MSTHNRLTSEGVFSLRYYNFYKAAGFKDVILDEIETYEVLGEEWKCVEMAIER